MTIVVVEWVRLRCWISNRLLDLGLIEAAKWMAPEVGFGRHKGKATP
jgi:hypothetical protein